ncbi:unnamed protein product [Fusarium langsethiae]|nr:unnamed protein product [Fusarium langsethiae]
MTKHTRNNSSGSRAPSGAQQQQQQQEAAPAAKPPRAPAGSLAEADAKVKYWNDFVLEGLLKLADWAEVQEQRRSAPQGQASVDDDLAKILAERRALRAKKEKEEEEEKEEEKKEE